MEYSDKLNITVETTVSVSPELAWAYWTEPRHITQWNQASDEWHTPRAENDLRVGGVFTSRMESKDGKYGFDFGGVYDAVEPYTKIAYTLGDGRRVSVLFEAVRSGTKITETFEAESQNTDERQKSGWQSILDHFKRYAEKQ